MRRYFYTDPLAASWMSKHFGMRFNCLEAKTTWDICASTMCLTLTADDVPYLIHPDSLHLLEPKVGDLVSNCLNGKNKGRECSGIIERLENEKKSAVITTCERHNGKRYFFESVSELTVIQRGGIAFMWPESEEV